MGTIDKSRGGVSVDPEFTRVQAACDRYGLSRSGLYRLAGLGHIRIVKLGGASLVDCSTVRAYLAALPAADIRVGQPRVSA